MTLQSAIYEGPVVHERHRPNRHRLRYEVFSLLLDLDELPELDRRFWVFGYNRFAPMAFHDRDHGPCTGAPLRPWAEERLAEAGITPDGGAIRLLCYPRIFGYAFNPLSVYYCYRRDKRLAAILYEVCNTFKERHTYVIPVTEEAGPVIRQSCDKALYVSPFIAMEATYNFRIIPPGDDVQLVIRQEDSKGLLLVAAFQGKRVLITGWSLIRSLIRFPLMTLKVIGGIHWEAVKLWRKGLPVFAHHPADLPINSSIEKQSASTPTK